MCKLTITLATVLLVQQVVSLVPFENNKEYKFRFEYGDKAMVDPPSGQKLSKFFNGDIYVRKSTDDDNHFIAMFKEFNSEGHGLSSDFETPFKFQVSDHNVVSLVTTGAWTEKDVVFKYDVMEEFFGDYSNTTSYLDSATWKEYRTIEQALGVCQHDVQITLSKTEIKVVAEGPKANCKITDEIMNTVPAGANIEQQLLNESESGIKMTFDRASMGVKEIELFSNLEMILGAQKSRYSLKTKFSFKYLEAKDVTEEIDFKDQVVVHSLDQLFEYKKNN